MTHIAERGKAEHSTGECIVSRGLLLGYIITLGSVQRIEIQVLFLYLYIFSYLGGEGVWKRRRGEGVLG